MTKFKFELKLKQIGLIGVTSAVLATSACSVVDSSTMNAQSAKQYRETITQAQSKQVLDTTSNTAKRVQTIFNKMVPFANQANQTGVPFNWEMSVIRSDELNAWAMPGGKMAVYTGIVEKLNLTDAEIAAIIGHEMTHALLEHSKKETNRNIGMSVLTQIGGQILTQTTGVNADLVNQGVGLAADLGVSKPFSRSAEKEADLGGLKLMAQAGYDPRSAVTVWQKMNAQNDNNNIVNKVLSTHPTNNARIELIQKELPNVLPIYQQAISKK